jgi:hypothetical protein
MPEHSHKKEDGPEGPWRYLLQNGPDHYDLQRSLGNNATQQVFRENRAAQHITPVLLDQVIYLLRTSPS